MNKITKRISKRLQKIAKRIDKMIEHVAGERIGFMLVVYTPERASYISSIDREDNIKQMKLMLELWEKETPDVPAHEFEEETHELNNTDK